MRNIFFLLIMLLGLNACTGNSVSFFGSQPAVSDSLMVEALVEMHIIAARRQQYKDLPESAEMIALSQFGITEEDFLETTSYYADNPDSFLVIQDRVLDKLGERLHALPTTAPDVGSN